MFNCRLVWGFVYRRCGRMFDRPLWSKWQLLQHWWVLRMWMWRCLHRWVYTVCPHVREDNPWALASGLSPVQGCNHRIHATAPTLKGPTHRWVCKVCPLECRDNPRALAHGLFPVQGAEGQPCYTCNCPNTDGSCARECDDAYSVKCAVWLLVGYVIIVKTCIRPVNRAVYENKVHTRI